MLTNKSILITGGAGFIGSHMVDLLLERARVELDESARFELYHQAEEIIVDDAPWVPLWHSNGGSVLIKPNVNDYFLFPLVIPKYRYVYFTE